MTRLVAALAAIAMLPALSLPAVALQTANADISPKCTDEAPESYKRAGGYCEQIDDLKSLNPVGGDNPCKIVTQLIFNPAAYRARVLVAIPDPCSPG